MFGLGASEILIILIIAFLLFGPKQLPEVGRQVGKAIKGFKDTADDLLRLPGGLGTVRLRGYRRSYDKVKREGEKMAVRKVG